MEFGNPNLNLSLDTRLTRAQLNNIFDINEIFKRRGHKVLKKEDTTKLLFKFDNYGTEKPFEALNSLTFRRIVAFVANSINGKTLKAIEDEFGKDFDPEKLKQNLEEAKNLGFLKIQDECYLATIKENFGPTFEWYIAELVARELGCVTYWGINIEGLSAEYDVVAIRGNQLGYVECKSGKFQNIKEDEIEEFLKRERILCPNFSIYLVDGISQKYIHELADCALSLSQNFSYKMEMPGIMNNEMNVNKEIYKNFIRLTPPNIFFVSSTSSNKPILNYLREIFRFLTQVCDKQLPMENEAAKKAFQ